MGSGIYYFNPTAEMAVANGIFSYQPPALLQSFERDMASVMLYFAGKSDVVLIHQHPNESFLDKIRSIKPDLPEFMTMNQLIDSGRKFDELVPWGWSPVVYKTLESVFPLLKDNFKQSAFYTWDQQYKTYYSRMTSAKVLEQICNESTRGVGEFAMLKATQCFRTSDVQYLLSENGKLVIKAPFSSSGRGLQMLRKHHLNNSNIAWINSILEKQEFVMAENLHHKIADLSFHFKLKNNMEPEYLGTVYFDTNSNGQFSGCFLDNHPENTINKITELFIENGGIKIMAAAIRKYFKNYEGFLGVDAMIIEQSGHLLLHPCVEINPRFTMGLLTLRIRKNIGSDGYWKMLFDKSGNLHKFFDKSTVPLTPVFPGTKFAAVLDPIQKYV
ncbi:hypothetical protein ACE01N_18065 [Saccharicrinis sp. FJH2]|uniref:hypothetical protein n=1 Tax=Saccharicrinis sp. FJH65 TaxID=3344659 RepID=UPI0035F4790C